MLVRQLKKVLRTLCPPGHQPLLLESAVTRQQAEVKLVFAEAEAAQVMQYALHRQLVCTTIPLLYSYSLPFS
jgi:hypothetical protein